MRDPIIRALGEFDESYRQRGFAVLAGVDEAGRGPLAGSVFAAAVVFPSGVEIPYLNDSKKIPEKRRELLFDEIREKAAAYGVGSASVEEIEAMNILNAAMLAMRRALAQLPVKPDLALIDGDKARGFDVPVECIIGGDARSQSVAAASVLAKVSRDRELRALSLQYPEYGFDQHKGYGTKAHYEALDRYGLSPVHRPSFLKKYFAARAGRSDL